MKRHLFLLMLSAMAVIVGCNKGTDGEKDIFVPPVQEQLIQNAYADSETTGDGFSFTADHAWTASVNERPQSGLRTLSPLRSAVHSKSSDGNKVVWLRLYNGSTEAYSGEAGAVTLRIEMDQNYTGERREAVITVRSGNNSFTVTVVQEGTRHDGTPNEAPVKVTGIILDKSELSLKKGDKAMLAATIEPADATIKSVLWSSSDPSVVEIDPVTGEMTALADGRAVVTATSSSNKVVSASCTVVVESDEPSTMPVQKMLKRVVCTTTSSTNDPSVIYITLAYDDQNRISFLRNDNFDGPDTYSETTYKYEPGKITAAYNYLNGVGTGKGGAVYDIADNGYATSARYEYLMDDESPDSKEVTTSVFVYDAAGNLSEVTEDRGIAGNRKTASLTWTGNNLTESYALEYENTDDKPHYRYKSTAKYGTDKVEGNVAARFVMDWATSSLYIPGAYEDMIPVYGNVSEYLPVEIRLQTWIGDATEPTVETDAFRYRIEGGYLSEAVVTVTEKVAGSEETSVRTETYVFEYE